MSGKTKTIYIPYSPQDYQREVHFSDARFRIVIMGRRGGKTELDLNELIRKGVTKPDLYWYLAPSYRQAKSIAWVRLKQLLRDDQMWLYNEQELSAKHRHLGTRLELRGADNEDSLRGVGLGGVVIDEAAMIKSNVWPEIIRPMLADKMGWALFTSTPKGRNWLFDLYTNKNPDIATFHHPTSINKFIRPEEIEQMRRDMSERLFKQEVLAEFLDDETGVFKRIFQCVTGAFQTPVLGRFYVIGVDLAKTQDWTVLTVIDSITRHVVKHIRIQEVSWREQKLVIQALAHEYNNALCIVDASGIGDPIVEDLRMAGVSVDPFKFTNASKFDLINLLAIAIEQRRITFPQIEAVINELQSFEYSITEGGNIKYSAPDGKHDDCVISLALAVWGIRTQLHEAQALQEPGILLSAQDRQGRGGRVDHDEDAEDYEYAGY